MGFSLDSLQPELVPYARALVAVAAENKLNPRVTSARRSFAEQTALYNRYLRGQQPFPVAAPGTSAHETGEAFDMVVTPEEYLWDLGALWREWGGQWGGQRDPVHFQLPGAPSPQLLTELRRPVKAPSLFDYAMSAMDLTSLVSLMLELGYVAVSEDEARRVARMLHIHLTDFPQDYP